METFYEPYLGGALIVSLPDKQLKSHESTFPNIPYSLSVSFYREDLQCLTFVFLNG